MIEVFDFFSLWNQNRPDRKVGCPGGKRRAARNEEFGGEHFMEMIRNVVVISEFKTNVW